MIFWIPFIIGTVLGIAVILHEDYYGYKLGNRVVFNKLWELLKIKKEDL